MNCPTFVLLLLGLAQGGTPAATPRPGAQEDAQQEQPKSGQQGAAEGEADASEAARAQLIETLAQAGVRLDLERQLVSIPATVLVRGELLEYLLVTERGQAHESLFLTDVQPSVLNTALLALGLEPGKNARFERPPAPAAGAEGEEAAVEDEAGGDQAREAQQDEAAELDAAAAAAARNVLPPEGDALYLYVAWREEAEVYFYRVDDLIADLNSGRSLKRHAWVYLGSRFVQPRKREGEPSREPRFAADFEGNLINISFFFQGNTLLTAARPECIEQTAWIGNEWLLPPRESPVEFLLSRAPLQTVPEAWLETLPNVKRAPVIEAGIEGR